jgi:hypothetical protein
VKRGNMPEEMDPEGMLILETRRAFAVLVEMTERSTRSEAFDVSASIQRRVGDLKDKSPESRDYVFLATEDGRVRVSSPGEDDDPVYLEVDGPVWVDPDYPITLAAFSEISSAIAWSRSYCDIEPNLRPEDTEGCPQNLFFQFSS